MDRRVFLKSAATAAAVAALFRKTLLSMIYTSRACS